MDKRAKDGNHTLQGNHLLTESLAPHKTVTPEFQRKKTDNSKLGKDAENWNSLTLTVRVKYAGTPTLETCTEESPEAEQGGRVGTNSIPSHVTKYDKYRSVPNDMYKDVQNDILLYYS